MRDGSRSGLEASDINDRDVLSKTKQLVNPQDHIRFKYVCDDGHVIQSEWMNREHARRGLMQWCDTVRSVLVQRAEDLAREKRQKAQELNAEKPVSKLILPEGLEDGTPEPDYEEMLRKRKEQFVEPELEEEFEEEEEEAPKPRKKPKKAKRPPVIEFDDEDDDDDDITQLIKMQLAAAQEQARKAAKKVMKLKRLLAALGDDED